jgi:hypothetical protein
MNYSLTMAKIKNGWNLIKFAPFAKTMIMIMRK